MQLSLALDQETGRLVDVTRRLRTAFGGFAHNNRLSPVDQLVRSLIASRTHEEASWQVFFRLKDRFRTWERLMAAPVSEVEGLLAPVAHAQDKAGWLPEALSRIAALNGALTLDILAEGPVEEAMAWLRRLPGVGDKVAAAVLNFSTLRRPVMVVDTHVWRVARRIGLAPRTAEPEAVRRAVMAAVPAGFTADDYFDLHWLLKRLGQNLCQQSHTRCGACPIAALCDERRRQLSRADHASAPLAFRARENKA